MSNIDKAAEHLGANALKMIKLILLKHDAAIIEASQEAIDQARKEEREKVAKWMMDRAYATGHGDSIEDLLEELQWQLDERWQGAIAFTMRDEREACAMVAKRHSHRDDDMGAIIERAIRARGKA